MVWEGFVYMYLEWWTKQNLGDSLVHLLLQLTVAQ